MVVAGTRGCPVGEKGELGVSGVNSQDQLTMEEFNTLRPYAIQNDFNNETVTALTMKYPVAMKKIIKRLDTSNVISHLIITKFGRKSNDLSSKINSRIIDQGRREIFDGLKYYFVEDYDG